MFLRKKSLVLLLFTLFFTIVAPAYTMGPYINAGVGEANSTVTSNIFDNPDRTHSVAARLGIGYIKAFSESNNPFFWGVEGNGNYYNAVGGDLSGILGKQFAPAVGVYGKLGLAAVADGKDSNGETQDTVGPQVGAGLGFQATPNLRVTAEGDLSLAALRASLTTVLVGVQYTF